MSKEMKKRKNFRIKARKRMASPRPLTINHSLLTKGQVILEFTFCMVIVLLMLYGITKVFVWTGREYVGRIQGHDETLNMNVEERYDPECIKSIGPFCIEWDSGIVYGPAQQIDPYYYTPVKMNAIWGER